MRRARFEIDRSQFWNAVEERSVGAAVVSKTELTDAEAAFKWVGAGDGVVGHGNCDRQQEQAATNPERSLLARTRPSRAITTDPLLSSEEGKKASRKSLLWHQGLIVRLAIAVRGRFVPSWIVLENKGAIAPILVFKIKFVSARFGEVAKLNNHFNERAIDLAWGDLLAR